jgi:hypothetical protein
VQRRPVSLTLCFFSRRLGSMGEKYPLSAPSSSARSPIKPVSSVYSKSTNASTIYNPPLSKMKSSLAILSALFLTAAHAASNGGRVLVRTRPECHLHGSSGWTHQLPGGSGRGAAECGHEYPRSLSPIISRLDSGLTTYFIVHSPTAAPIPPLTSTPPAAGMKMRSRSAQPRDTRAPRRRISLATLTAA